MIFGLTHSGKSSLCVTHVEYVWETYHGVSLVYLTDGGGILPQMQTLVERGIARLWRMRTRSAPGLAFETCQRASQGWWPARISPHTGETMPNVPLVPPMTLTYEMRCAQGHTVKTVPSRGMLTVGGVCPTCKQQVTAQTMTVVTHTKRTKGFELVMGVVFDGLSSMGDWMMDDLGERAGRNELGGEKGNLGTIVSGDYASGSTNRASFGFVQTRLQQMVLNSSGIPGLAIRPVWTALTSETSDEGNLQVRGPLLVGQAKTAIAGQWFGDTIETMTEERGGKRYRRMMLQQWIDARNIRHLCGVRSYPAMLPAFLEEEEVQDPRLAFSTFSMAHFYRLREEARRRTEEMLAEKYAGAPGLPDGEMEYGEVAAVVAAPAAAPAPVAPAAPVRPAAPAAAKPAPVATSTPAGPQHPASPAAPPVAAAPRPTPAAAAPVAPPAPPPVAAPAPVAARPVSGPTPAPPAPLRPPAAPARGAVPPPPGRKPGA